MNLHLFFVRPSLFFYFICAVLSTASCARKNRRVYDFSTPRPLSAQRVGLPYVAYLKAIYDKKLKRYDLAWKPLSIIDVPSGIRFIGYNIYKGTRLGFCPRQSNLQVPPEVQSCLFEGSLVPGDRQLFGIAPLFCDQYEREITGLRTVTTLYG
jgi:hypothetical protein